jgi:Fe-S cluster biosynthesis and repair protein YggX
MPDIDMRIEQFKKMANDDPDNELGHFSLGRAYLDAGNYDAALESFQRVIQINANMSRAYQLAATAQLRKGDRGQAVASLTRGVAVAHERGDMMPKTEMMQMLKELGAAVPEFQKTEAERPVGQGEVLCSRCNRVGPKLASPPFSNAQGRLIQEKICAPCWKEWIAMGTKVINELRLPLSDPQAQKVFDQQMMEFLNLR